MKLFFLTLIFLFLAVMGIAVKIWLKKGGRFSGTCAGQSPFLNKGEHCSVCGAKPEEQGCKG